MAPEGKVVRQATRAPRENRHSAIGTDPTDLPVRVRSTILSPNYVQWLSVIEFFFVWLV